MVSTSFTPWSSLAGGILIGLSASALLLFLGRIAGISGIVGGLPRAKRHDRSWRLSFLLGLISGGWVLKLCHAESADYAIGTSLPTLIIAGILVGFGTRLGGGCTSGHGVCGLARRSPRSLVATLTFMASGFLTVAIVRHLLGSRL